MFGVACILLQFLIATSLVYPLSAMHFCFRFFPKPSRDTYRPPSTTLACMFLLFQFSSSPTERLVSYYSLLDLEFRNSQYIDAFAFYDLGFIFATYSHAKFLPISNSARSYIHLFVSLGSDPNRDKQCTNWFGLLSMFCPRFEFEVAPISSVNSEYKQR